MPRPSCKALILDAAEAVVMNGGAARLTLDAVAEKAGISKGGVLYHFPTKEALHVGMIERLIELAAERLAAMRASLPDAPGRDVKADISSILISRESDDRVSAALLAAIANEPQLMASVRDYHMRRFESHHEPEALFARKAVIMLAADGLFLMELLQVAPFTKEQRQALVDELMAMADGIPPTA